MGVIEQDPNDFLDTRAICSIQSWRSVRPLHKLRGSAIGGSLPGMWCVFQSLWLGMLESFECPINVARHG